MRTYSITFNAEHVTNIEMLEKSIKAISFDFIRVFDFQCIIRSELPISGISDVISTCLIKGSPMFVCLIDSRSHVSRHLESLVADRVIQVLS